MSIKLVVFRVQDPFGKALGGAIIRGVRPKDDWAITTQADGYAFPNLELDTYEVTVTHPNWTPRVMSVTLLPNTGADEPIIIGLSGGNSGPLPRLTVRGDMFQKGSELFTVMQCSDFNLYGRFLKEGADAIRPVLEERSAMGFNMLRVWAEYQGGPQFTIDIGRLVPGEHPSFYADLKPFLALCESYGLYVELTAFTGADIPGHWDRLNMALVGIKNVLVELVNECDSHTPTIDPTKYPRMIGIMCSHGSNGSQAIPPRPAWDYETFHTNDASEWWRKGGHNGMELSHGAEGLQGSGVPVINNEKTRPDRDTNPNHHHDDAAGGALLVAGSCFHSASGKKSALFDTFDKPFAEAFLTGCRSVRLAYQDGRYSHPIELEGPEDLRVYKKTLPDGSYELGRIRK